MNSHTVYRIEYEDSKKNWINLNEVMCLFSEDTPEYYESKKQAEQVKEEILSNKASANLRICAFLPEIKNQNN